MKHICIALAVFAISTSALATNYPCSGHKSGVSHCMGQYFVCNDGSISQSKKVCSAGESAPPKPAKIEPTTDAKPR